MVVIAAAISHAKLQSNRHHQQTQLFTGQIPFLLPNQQCQNTERNIETLYMLVNYISVQHMTVSDIILEATKQFGIDAPPGLVSVVCTYNIAVISSIVAV